MAESPTGSTASLPPAESRRLWIRLLSAAVTLAALAVLVVYLVANWSHVRASYSMPPGPIAAMALMMFGILALRAAAHRAIFRRAIQTIRYGEWFEVVAAGALSNLLPLSAGLVTKAYLVKRIHALSYRSYTGGQLALFLLGLVSSGLVGLAALFFLPWARGTWIVGVAFLGMLIAGSVLLCPGPPVSRIWSKLGGVGGAKTPDLLGAAMTAGVLHASTLLLSAGKLYLAFSLGPERVPFAACLVFAAVGIATRFVTVTPGALGVRELLIGALAQLTGFSLGDALIASTIDRVVEVVVTCAVGGVASFRLTTRL